MKPFITLRGVHSLDHRLGKKSAAALSEDFWQTMSGWRGLFDCGSAEYQQTTPAEKAKMLDRLTEFFGCGVDVLIYLWAKENLPGRLLYRLDGLHHALYEMAESSTAVEQYLLRCHHPYLRVCKERLTVGNWREAVRRLIRDRTDPTLVNKDNVHLFLLNAGSTHGS